MEKMGVRDVKIHLCRLIEEVIKGREVIITKHGRPVARLCSMENDSLTLDERVTRMEREGQIGHAAGFGSTALPPPLPLREEMAQELLREERDAG